MVIAFSPGSAVSSNPGYAPGSAPGFDGGGFLPNVLSDLALWIDAADFSTITKDGSDLVSQIDDKSGNGKNITQGTGANQPLWVDNVFNGHATIRFDGTNDRLATDGTFAIGSNITVFIVSKAVTTANKQVFMEQTVSIGVNDGFQFNSAGNRPVGVKRSAILIVPPQNNNWMGTSLALGSFTYDGDGIEYFLNGISQNATAGVLTDAIITDNLFIGGRAASGTINTDGDISEIIIYSRAISTAEMAAVDNYLMNKWGL